MTKQKQSQLLMLMSLLKRIYNMHKVVEINLPPGEREVSAYYLDTTNSADWLSCRIRVRITHAHTGIRLGVESIKQGHTWTTVEDGFVVNVTDEFKPLFAYKTVVKGQIMYFNL